MNRSLKRNRSGQVLVISALLVAIILLSTAAYVVEVEKNVPTISGEKHVFFGHLEAFRNAMISALANATNGGSHESLASDLADLQTFITSHSYEAMLTVNYSLCKTAPYADGLWIDWNSGEGQGISSACVSFHLSSQSATEKAELYQTVNLTTSLNVSCKCIQLNETTKQVNLNLMIKNEDKPALAQSLAFSYQNDGEWITVYSPVIEDFGNGAYAASFFAQTNEAGGLLHISVRCLDRRGIMVGAEVQCNDA
ncbi:MAG: hypothetical protein NWE98_01315 [Candidatus Bathyarchaeota archaeon]|nr:hypothetical protein [Candidatus Bathyarchaeota archaeon]